MKSPQFLLGERGAGPLSGLAEIPDGEHVVLRRITAAELKAMRTTPAVLVDGASDRIRLPVSVQIIKEPGTAYVLNGNANIQVRLTAANVIVSLAIAGVLDNTSETFIFTRLGSNLAYSTAGNPGVVGSAIDLRLDVADMVTGDGDLRVRLIYDDRARTVPEI